jgi:hypothetical protein
VYGVALPQSRAVRSIHPLGRRSLEGLELKLLLSPRLHVRPLRKLLYDLPGIPHATGHIQNGLVADDVGKAVDLSEELRLKAVDVLSLSEAFGYHVGASVGQDAS